jgi:hypothetical protein
MLCGKDFAPRSACPDGKKLLPVAKTAYRYFPAKLGVFPADAGDRFTDSVERRNRSHGKLSPAPCSYWRPRLLCLFSPQVARPEWTTRFTTPTTTTTTPGITMKLSTTRGGSTTRTGITRIFGNAPLTSRKRIGTIATTTARGLRDLLHAPITPPQAGASCTGFFFQPPTMAPIRQRPTSG